MSSFPPQLPLLQNSILTIYFYRVGFTLTFLLGFFGNVASLLTFSRPTLRKVSTGFLFMALAISDLVFLLICLLDYFEFGWQVSRPTGSFTSTAFATRFPSTVVSAMPNCAGFARSPCISLSFSRPGSWLPLLSIVGFERVSSIEIRRISTSTNGASFK